MSPFRQGSEPPVLHPASESLAPVRQIGAHSPHDHAWRYGAWPSSGRASASASAPWIRPLLPGSLWHPGSIYHLWARVSYFTVCGGPVHTSCIYFASPDRNC